MSTEVVITGTGVPVLSPGRAGPGVLVRYDRTALQFDAGRATSLRLYEAGTQPQDLDALFVTHHHSDHLTGLVDLVFARWLQSPRGHTPLPIVAPIGPASRYVERMLEPWGEDIASRMEHVGRSDGPEPQRIDFEPSADAREVWSNGHVHVQARRVHHEPLTPAVAYRIQTPDGVVVISGDTVACDEVAELSWGAEVLVHEAFRRDALRPLMKRLPQLALLAAYHADTLEVGSLAKRAGVRRLVLTHLIPAPQDEAGRQGFTDDVRAGGFAGELIVAEDGASVRF